VALHSKQHPLTDAPLEKVLNYHLVSVQLPFANLFFIIIHRKVEALREKEEKEKEARRKKLFEGMFAGAEVAQRRLKF